MAAFICRMCGARLEIPNKTRTCKCNACGVSQSVPMLDSDDKQTACRNAERLRREGHYDKALELLSDLIRLSPADADLYWAAALCRYGVEFSISGNSLSVTRRLAKSFLTDEDYISALRFAGKDQRRLMESAAAKIDEVRRRSAGTLGGHDVVLVCEDPAVRARIKAKLTGRYNVLCGLNGDVSAVDTVKVLIVSGGCKADFEGDIIEAFANSGRMIIPVADGFPAEELPEKLRKYQAADTQKLGWENDIVNGLDMLFGKNTAQTPPSRSSNPMLRRIYIMLEDGDFSGA
ncbi:MAG: hypothetical protein K2J80_03560, partial [Oscillospiraceae bacterium]|nr:hypothetical protein [Oscillospiraceae bacterium]